MCGVYEIIGPGGRRYVGSAASFSARWSQHRRLLRAGIHHSAPLQAAWNKYGETAMLFRVVEVVNGGREARLAREQCYIDALGGNGYNVAKIATSRQGVPQSAKTKLKMKKSQTARWAAMTPEQRLAHSDAVKSNWGDESRRQAASDRAKALAGKPGRIPSEQTRQRISVANKKATDQKRLALLLTYARAPKSLATREKMRIAALARKKS